MLNFLFFIFFPLIVIWSCGSSLAGKLIFLILFNGVVLICGFVAGIGFQLMTDGEMLVGLQIPPLVATSVISQAKNMIDFFKVPYVFIYDVAHIAVYILIERGNYISWFFVMLAVTVCYRQTRLSL